MFKKWLIFLLVLSPLIFSIVFGFPIVSNLEYQNRSKINTQIKSSLRCFAIGDLNGYIGCVKNSKHFLNGMALIKRLINELESMHKGFGFVYFPLLFTQIILVAFVFAQLLGYSSKGENRNGNN